MLIQTQWIGVDPWFGTATITTTINGIATTVPIHKGFSVSTNAEGKIDIAISEELMGILEQIFASAPTCARAKGMALRKRSACAARLNYVAQQYGSNTQLQAATQQLAEDMAAEIGGVEAGEAVQFGLDSMGELGELIAIMYPGLTAGEIDVIATSAITAASFVASIYAIHEGMSQIMYKLSAATPKVVKVEEVKENIQKPTKMPISTATTSMTSTSSSSSIPCPTETQNWVS